MTGLKKGVTFSVLAFQIAMPLLVLAQSVDDPVVSDICGVINIIKKIARYLLVVLVILAIIFVILAAFKYLTAGGDAEKVGAANKQILYAVVAIAVGLLASGVVPIVARIITGAGTEECPDIGGGPAA